MENTLEKMKQEFDESTDTMLQGMHAFVMYNPQFYCTLAKNIAKKKGIRVCYAKYMIDLNLVHLDNESANFTTSVEVETQPDEEATEKKMPGTMHYLKHSYSFY